MIATPLYVRITEGSEDQENTSIVVGENETFLFGALGWSGGLRHVDLYRASGERVRFDLEYFKKVAVAVDHIDFQPQPRGLENPELRAAFLRAGKPDFAGLQAEIDRLRKELNAATGRTCAVCQQDVQVKDGAFIGHGWEGAGAFPSGTCPGSDTTPPRDGYLAICGRRHGDVSEVGQLREERDAFKTRLMETFVYMTLAADKIETTSTSRTDIAEEIRRFVRDGHKLP